MSAPLEFLITIYSAVLELQVCIKLWGLGF